MIPSPAILLFLTLLCFAPLHMYSCDHFAVGRPAVWFGMVRIVTSVAGIPTFRGGSGSIWSVTAATQGRRSVFLRDPLRWYNEFWLRHFPLSFTRMTPNVGHEAISLLAQTFPELRVITQNIDGLVSSDS